MNNKKIFGAAVLLAVLEAKKMINMTKDIICRGGHVRITAALLVLLVLTLFSVDAISRSRRIFV